jgi:hypothetical protein
MRFSFNYSMCSGLGVRYAGSVQNAVQARIYTTALQLLGSVQIAIWIQVAIWIQIAGRVQNAVQARIYTTCFTVQIEYRLFLNSRKTRFQGHALLDRWINNE